MNLRFEQPFEEPNSTTRSHFGIGEGETPGELFSIDRVRSPRSVPPGETVFVEIDWSVDIDWSAIDSDDQNYCNAGGVFREIPGGEMFTRAYVGSSTDSGERNCWALTNPDTITSTRQVAVPTTPGEYEIEVEVVGANDMRTYDSRSETIVVDEDSPDPDDDPDNGDGDGDDSWEIELPWEGDGFPEIPSTGIIALVLMLVLLLVIAVLS